MSLRSIDIFIAAVDPNKTTVVSFPDFVAVFGGEILTKRRAKTPKSRRAAFIQWLSIHRPELQLKLVVPESYDDWNDFDVYSDLLEFEQDLGYLTSAVVVFLEGPGAIAELGAFSQIQSLWERLLIVVGEHHHPIKSFISLGPIRNVLVTKNQGDSICVIPNVKPKDLPEHAAVIMDALDKRRHRGDQTMSFDKKNTQHQILLVLDLIRLFLAPQLQELQQLVSHFGIDLSLRRLKQIIFLLEKTKLVESHHYGNSLYLSPSGVEGIYIDYSAPSKARSFNRTSMTAKIWNELQTTPRKNVIASLKKGASK